MFTPETYKHHNIMIGRNIRHLREARGLTQVSLGRALGVSFQQIQKYERGENVISAARVHVLSLVLDCPYESFFKDIEPVTAPFIPRLWNVRSKSRHYAMPLPAPKYWKSLIL